MINAMAKIAQNRKLILSCIHKIVRILFDRIVFFGHAVLSEPFFFDMKHIQWVKNESLGAGKETFLLFLPLNVKGPFDCGKWLQFREHKEKSELFPKEII